MARQRTSIDAYFLAPVLSLMLLSYIAYILLVPFREAFATLDWPKTSGVIVGASVRQLNFGLFSLYAPQIVYTYHVQRNKYLADDLLRSFLPSYLSFSKESALRWTLAYPQGKWVVIYYAKNNPHQAVIEPGVDESHYVALMMAAVILSVGARFFYLRLRAYRKFVRQRRRERIQVVYR